MSSLTMYTFLRIWHSDGYFPMQWFCQTNPQTGERRAQPFSTNMVGPNGVDKQAVLYLDWVGTHWEGHTWPGKADELVCGTSTYLY